MHGRRVWKQSKAKSQAAFNLNGLGFKVLKTSKLVNPVQVNAEVDPTSLAWSPTEARDRSASYKRWEEPEPVSPRSPDVRVSV